MFAGLATLPFAEHIAVYMIGPVLTTILAIILVTINLMNTDLKKEDETNKTNEILGFQQTIIS